VHRAEELSEIGRSCAARSQSLTLEMIFVMAALHRQD
jgi:hypothetical protein